MRIQFHQQGLVREGPLFIESSFLSVSSLCFSSVCVLMARLFVGNDHQNLSMDSPFPYHFSFPRAVENVRDSDFDEHFVSTQSGNHLFHFANSTCMTLFIDE